MPQHIGYIALLVRDYDEAISYFIEKLGFTVAEDTDLGGGKRWVLVAPPGSVDLACAGKGSICGPIASHRESDWWPRLPILAH
jgi:catechol 2,3-dioxygenase-like lactoylglutathione lyase family enzyme